ncbi:MAG: hypothetical protein ABH919_02230 [bacterium]
MGTKNSGKMVRIICCHKVDSVGGQEGEIREVSQEEARKLLAGYGLNSFIN